MSLRLQVTKASTPTAFGGPIIRGQIRMFRTDDYKHLCRTTQTRHTVLFYGNV